MKVTATIDTSAAVRSEEASLAGELEVQAIYDAGVQQLRGLVLDGWQMLSIGVPDRTDTCGPGDPGGQAHAQARRSATSNAGAGLVVAGLVP